MHTKTTQQENWNRWQLKSIWKYLHFFSVLFKCGI